MQNNNKKILNETKTDEQPKCNCQKKERCPIPDKCLSSCIIYLATVKSNAQNVEYIGSTADEFKTRYNNHTLSFRASYKKHETALSSYVWDRHLNPRPNIKWSILKLCKIYSPGQKDCDLYLSGKFFIIKNLNKTRNLNKKTDIGNKCVHK